MDMRHNLPDGHPAYAETMACVRLEQRRNEYLDARIDQLLTLLKNRAWSGARQIVCEAPWTPIDAPSQVSVVQDCAYWIQDHVDPATVTTEFLLGRESEIFARYAVARASFEADKIEDNE
jgi:hypothetical protein